MVSDSSCNSSLCGSTSSRNGRFRVQYDLLNVSTNPSNKVHASNAMDDYCDDGDDIDDGQISVSFSYSSVSPSASLKFTYDDDRNSSRNSSSEQLFGLPYDGLQAPSASLMPCDANSSPSNKPLSRLPHRGSIDHALNSCSERGGCAIDKPTPPIRRKSHKLNSTTYKSMSRDSMRRTSPENDKSNLKLESTDDDLCDSSWSSITSYSVNTGSYFNSEALATPSTITTSLITQHRRTVHFSNDPGSYVSCSSAVAECRNKVKNSDSLSSTSSSSTIQWNEDELDEADFNYVFPSTCKNDSYDCDKVIDGKKKKRIDTFICLPKSAFLRFLVQNPRMMFVLGLLCFIAWASQSHVTLLQPAIKGNKQSATVLHHNSNEELSIHELTHDGILGSIPDTDPVLGTKENVHTSLKQNRNSHLRNLVSTNRNAILTSSDQIDDDEVQNAVIVQVLKDELGQSLSSNVRSKHVQRVL